MDDDFEYKDSAVKSNCISFLGSTHNGKSFTINSITGQHYRGVAEEDVLLPTSRDIHAVNWLDPANPENVYARLVDYEGENGGLFPVDSASACVGCQQQSVDWHEVQHQRKDAVHAYFPKVAYLTSDIIVYVTTHDLADHNVAEALLTFACHSTNGVQRESPSLLIIVNKVDPYKLSNSKYTNDQVLLQFLETHDPDIASPHTSSGVQLGAIKSAYADVRVFRMPLDNGDPNNTAASKVFINTKTSELQYLLHDMLLKRTSLRRYYGTDFTMQFWHPIFAEVVEASTNVIAYSENISMSEVISKYLVRRSARVAQVSINCADLFFHLHAIHLQGQGFQELQYTSLLERLTMLFSIASAIVLIKKLNTEPYQAAGEANKKAAIFTFQETLTSFLENFKAQCPCSARSEMVCRPFLFYYCVTRRLGKPN